MALSACHASPRPAVNPANPATSARPTGALERLGREIEARLDAPPLEHGTWAIVIRSVDRGDTLYERNPHKLLMPASGMKTVTLAAAAARLGWDFSFETRVVADGAVDERFLNGDLVVVGTGDPSLDDWDGAATRLFESWAATIKVRGIDTVGGRLVGNDNAIEDAGLGSGWAWDDLDRSFATSVGALQFNQNAARLTVNPAEAESSPPEAALAPEGNGLILRNSMETVPVGVPTVFQTRRLVGTPLLELRGSIPVRSAPLVRTVSVQNPTLYFANALRKSLIANGIDVRGPAVDIDDLPDAPHGAAAMTLVSHRSPPLSALSVTMMKLSQNLYAETIFQVLGGTDAVLAVLDGWGISRSDLLVADGSGLSRYNLVTADVLAAILAHMALDEELRQPFQDSLPVAGRDGTLAQRMKGTAADGNVRAKTGSFSNARSLAGYVRTGDGETLAFALIANNFGVAPSLIEETMDAIAVRLAEFRRGG